MKKLKETVILRENMKDSDGHIFPDSLLKRFDGEEHVVLLNFDPKKALGKAKFSYKENIGITAKLSLHKTDLGNAIFSAIRNGRKIYPSIVGVIKEQDNAGKIIDMQFNSVALTDSKNTDPAIKPVEIEIRDNKMDNVEKNHVVIFEKDRCIRCGENLGIAEKLTESEAEQRAVELRKQGKKRIRIYKQ